MRGVYKVYRTFAARSEGRACGSRLAQFISVFATVAANGIDVCDNQKVMGDEIFCGLEELLRSPAFEIAI